MNLLKAVLTRIDFLSDRSGKLVSWLIVVLILSLSYDTFMRYLFRAPTIWAYDVNYMLGGTVMLMGMAYASLHKTHIRVDILYNYFPAKMKTIIDVVFNVLIFFPLYGMLLYKSADRAIWSFHSKEFSEVGFWRPVMWPFRTMIPVAIALFLLAGIAWVIRDLYLLRKGKEL